MKVYIWQKGSLRLGNEECQEVLAALLIACYCAPARAQIDETRVFSTFLHLPNIWPDGCGSWFSFNIWSIFFFQSIFGQYFGFQSIFGQYLIWWMRPPHFWQILAVRVLVTACLVPLKNQHLVSHQVCLVSFLASTGCKGRKTHCKNWCYRQWSHIKVKEILLTTCSRPGKCDLDGCWPMTLWPFRKTR